MTFGRIFEHLTIKTIVILAFVCIAGQSFAAPATLTQSVTYGGETITMQLTKENLRGSQFELWEQNSLGEYDVVTPVEERSYIGTVDEYPDAISCGILGDDGTFRGGVYFDRGVSWWTSNSSVISTRALDYGIDTFTAYHYPTAPTVAAGQAGTAMYGFDVGVDADYNYFNGPGGGSVANAFEDIEYSVCLVQAIYMKDVLLRPYLGRVIIRATLAHDPYTGLTQGDYLSAVRTEWNSNHTAADSDVVAGVSPTKIGGGLAWVGVVGTSSGYSVSQGSSTTGRFDVVWRHEMGHNWDLGHYVGGTPEGAGLNGGNQPARFSACEAYRVFNHRNDKLSDLDNEGTYSAIDLPPYAALDAAEFTQTVSTSLTLDVLANDYDANGDTISIHSYDTTSTQGGTITLQGQDLVYTAPNVFPATDYFIYTISDSTSQTASGVVIIDLIPAFAINPTDTFSTKRYDGLKPVLSSRTYTLENNGSSSLNWTANKTVSWFDLSVSSGSVPAGGSVTIDVTLNSGVEALPLGTYSDTITFTDTTNGTVLPRDVEYSYEILRVPQSGWTLQYFDSEETSAENTPATNAFDGDASSFWHTEWSDAEPTHPHEIQFDLGDTYDVRGFAYLPRQSGQNGRIADYEFYVSTDGSNWGSALATGTFVNTADEQQVLFDAVTARYIRLVALSEVNGNKWTSVAELNVFYNISNGLLREAWLGIGGGSVSDLTSDPDYPNSPGVTEILTTFEGPTDWGDNYGSRIHGYLIPPTTGNYTFWISSDDASELWLSSDSGPVNAAKIAQVTWWTDPREWGTGEQQSGQIALNAGQLYYIMALHKEGGGADHVAVAWSGPGISQQVIDGDYLMPYGRAIEPTFTNDPFSTTDALEGYDYNDSIAGSATALDGGAVSYSKAAGPLWLAVDPSGALTGVPGNGDLGGSTFTVTATDTYGYSSDATLQLTVLNTFTGELGLPDFAALAARWLDADCTDSPPCGGADLSGDNGVAVDDLAALGSMWLIQKTYGGLVSAWPFDTDASDVVSGHNGTLVNDAFISTTDPVIGVGALALDGVDDFVEVTGYKGVTGSASRTCSAWIRANGSTEPSMIMSWGASIEGQAWMVGLLPDGRLSANLFGADVTGTAVINDGQWHHVAVVLGGDLNGDGRIWIEDVRLYIDGNLDPVSSISTGSNPSAQINTSSDMDVTLGVRDYGDHPLGYAFYFNGLIDEARIYDRALTSAEVNRLASIPLHLHLPFDETTGTTAEDISRYERPGQLLNGPLWQPTGGQVNGALEFDGVDDFVQITGYRGIAGTQARTCSAWIKANESTEPSMIMSWGASVEGQAWMVGLLPDGRLSANLFGADVTGTAVINDGQWHHVAVTLGDDLNGDGKIWIEDVRLYIDGNLDPISSINTGSNPSAYVNTSSDMDVTLGVRNYGDHPLGYAFYFNGLLDEVRIYDNALSQEEILAVMNE